jgi:molecular chaperone DnaJ
MNKDYYKILGINRSASAEEIKKAYRQLAHQYHPDRPGGDEKRFKEINEAYQVLSNREKRSQYDQFGTTFDGLGKSYGFGGGGGFGFNFDPANFEDLNNVGEIFDAFFEGLGVKKRKTYYRGADLEVDLEISLEEAFRGIEKKTAFSGLASCKECSGLGHFAAAGFTKCQTCGGQGEIRENRNTFFGSFSQVRSCAKCFGTGQIPNKMCSACTGTGRVKQAKEVTVTIAPGIRDGQIIKLVGAGEAGERAAAAGDLYVKIKVKPHPIFAVKGNDLFAIKEVSLIDVLLGRKIQIKNISGGVIDLEIPPGANLNNDLRIPGEGMPQLGSIHRRGDLYVRFNIKTPKKFSAKAKKLLDDLKEEIE